MQSLFTLLGTIAINADPANQAIEDTTQNAEQSSGKVSEAFGKIGSAALTIGKAVVGAGMALGGAWIAAIEGSREYRTQMGMLDTAFQASGHSSEMARQTYSDLNAVLGDSGQATEAAQMLAVLADNEKDLSTWTNIATGVYARMGEAIPLEELAQSSSETAKSGILTGGLVDALIQAGHSEEEFQAKLDACTGEQERQKLIMDTLNGSYAEASEQYKTTNKDVLEANKAQEKLTNAMAELGRVGEPILTAIKNKVAEMVALAVPKLESFVKKVKDLKKWVNDNKQTIHNWAAGIIAATTSVGTFLLILNWGKIMTAAKTAIAGVRAAIILFNAALRANPIGIVISLLAGLVAGFIYLWNNNKGFRDFWLSMWAKIKSASGSAINWVKGKFNDFKAAFNTVKTVFNNIQKTISDKMNSARDKVRSAIDKIKGFFKFNWSLPKLKMPSFSVTGKFSLNPPSVPKLGIKWNAEGAVLKKPTIFGQLQDGTMMGGGEAGHEAIAPISVLQEYVRTAVRAETSAIGAVIVEQSRAMMDFLKRTIPHDVLLDGTAMVGALLPAIDTGLNDRLVHARRGNVR